MHNIILHTFLAQLYLQITNPTEKFRFIDISVKKKIILMPI
jgi:hypothetical protein